MAPAKSEPLPAAVASPAPGSVDREGSAGGSGERHGGASRGRELALTSLGALGVVYGDIGTSPLYAVKECLAWHPSGAWSPHAVVPILPNVLGVLSLVFWALVLVICIKYLVFVLRADNNGEGGILALAALVIGCESRPSAGKLAVPLVLGLFGTGLLFGDGVITPAISVLGAVEGLSEQNHALSRLIIPIAVVILIGLFLVQRHGAGRIGTAFGPVMLVWFIAIGAIGLRWIIERPVVLQAVNPMYAARFLAEQGAMGFFLIGLVFLVVTGGEALYADMGHFGKRPIRVAWFTVVLPGLLLNYFGQGALLLTREPGTVKNPFYEAVEGPLLIPMLALATAAAVIASQALISGVFSITRQAVQLGFWPRVSVVHTSAKTAGQIYVPEMNWLLMVGCIAVVVQFGSSSGLAAAYGVAVTATMVITSLLFYLVCRRRWGFSQPRALSILIPFVVMDLAFFSANAAKILDGGWFPLVIGVLVFTIMTTWWRGRLVVSQAIEAGTTPDELFLGDLAEHEPHRVRGTAVFMSSAAGGIPNMLMHHLKHNQVLHERVILLAIQTEAVPWVDLDRGIEIQDLDHGFSRVIASFGFMQTPDVPEVLSRCAQRGIPIEPMTTTYYLEHLTLISTGKAKLAYWRKLLFAFLARNARPPTAFFHLPPNRVVELGAQIEL